jgi:hypothetical protein
MKQAGYAVNETRKHITFCEPGRKPMRLDTLKGDYTEQAVRERIAGTRVVASAASGSGRAAAPKAPARPAPQKPNLLIDIQAKMRQGYGKGYERWATVFNVREMAKTLLFLQENGVTDHDMLEKKAAETAASFSEISGKIQEAEARMSDISTLQKHISNYRRTRDVYKAYREAGYGKKFRAEHEAEIRSHQAAKKYFDSLGMDKLPAINALKQEYAALLAERKKLYSGYRDAKEKMKQYVTAKANVRRILHGSDIGREQQKHDGKHRGQDGEI